MRVLTLVDQHIVVAALENHLKKFPESKRIQSIIDSIAAPFPVIFITDNIEEGTAVMKEYKPRVRI